MDGPISLEHRARCHPALKDASSERIYVVSHGNRTQALSHLTRCELCLVDPGCHRARLSYCAVVFQDRYILQNHRQATSTAKHSLERIGRRLDEQRPALQLEFLSPGRD